LELQLGAGKLPQSFGKRRFNKVAAVIFAGRPAGYQNQRINIGV